MMSGSVTKHVVSEHSETSILSTKVDSQTVSKTVADTHVLFRESEVFRTLQRVESNLVSVGTQGPSGPVGGIDTITPEDIGALAVAARLSEFSTEQARVDARTNLGVQVIDAGTFN